MKSRLMEFGIETCIQLDAETPAEAAQLARFAANTKREPAQIWVYAEEDGTFRGEAWFAKRKDACALLPSRRG